MKIQVEGTLEEIKVLLTAAEMQKIADRVIKRFEAACYVDNEPCSVCGGFGHSSECPWYTTLEEVKRTLHDF